MSPGEVILRSSDGDDILVLQETSAGMQSKSRVQYFGM